MYFLLECVWTSIAQTWDQELSTKQTFFSAGLREISTRLINRLLINKLGNGCTKLSYLNFNASEAMCIAASFKVKAGLKLTDVIGNFLLPKISHKTKLMRTLTNSSI